MNDQEIMLAALKDWPDAARPSLQPGKPGHPWRWWIPFDGVMNPIGDDHAIALFRDSGLGWLYEHENTEVVTFTIGESSDTHVQLELDHFQDPTSRNRMKPGATKYNGPTRLSAIDQAIRSIK